LSRSSGSGRKDRISVMTLNLRFGLANDGPDGWEFRKPRVAALFAQHRPDIVAFQEANGFQIDFLGSVLSDYGVIGRRDPAPPFWQNNVIFFKAPLVCVFSDYFFLSHTPDTPSRFAESRWPRQCTIGLFQIGGRRFAVVNTHFDFEETVQRRSAVLILERLKSLPERVPTIVMGDFNALPGSAGHRVFTDSRRRTKGGAQQFTPVFSPPYPATHHDFAGNSDGSHIDWILFRGGLRVESTAVCRSPMAGGYPSDHFPVCAEFSWVPDTAGG